MTEEPSEFWKEVEQGYLEVAANHDLEVTVARDNKEATITYGKPDQIKDDIICIYISDCKTATVETLPIPPTAGGRR